MKQYGYEKRNGHDGHDDEGDHMMKTDAISYLGLLDGISNETVQVQNLAVIEFAEDRGYWIADLLPGLAVNHARAIGAGTELEAEHSAQDLDTEVAAAATLAVEYLNDQGLIPNGYGYDPTRPLDGFGIDSTARGEGS